MWTVKEIMKVIVSYNEATLGWNPLIISTVRWWWICFDLEKNSSDPHNGRLSTVINWCHLVKVIIVSPSEDWWWISWWFEGPRWILFSLISTQSVFPLIAFWLKDNSYLAVFNFQDLLCSVSSLQKDEPAFITLAQPSNCVFNNSAVVVLVDL